MAFKIFTLSKICAACPASDMTPLIHYEKTYWLFYLSVDDSCYRKNCGGSSNAGFFYYLFMAAKKESYFCLFALDQHEVRHAGWCRRIRGLIFPPEGKQLPCFRRV
jgi:hypothetical protein